MTFTAIDCQSFAGGFSLGVVQAGFKLIAKREHPGGFGVPAMESNRELLGQDWKTQISDPADWEPLKADLVFGNPPCSGFSNLSSDRDQEWRDAKNACITDLVNYAAQCDPQIVIFESVQGAYTRGLEFVRERFADLKAATGGNWTLYHVLHNSGELGGAQKRRRYFWVASRIPFGVSLPGDKRVTVIERIGDLMDKPLGSVNGHSTIPSNRARMIANLAAEAEWNEGEVSGQAHLRRPDIQISSPDKRLRGEFPTWRLYSDRQSKVMNGNAAERILHPQLPRTLSIRELARLMGFPDEWNLEEYTKVQARMKWLGKGVCVEAGRWIAEAAHAALAGQPFGYSGIAIGPNEYLIDAENPTADLTLFDINLDEEDEACLCL